MVPRDFMDIIRDNIMQNKWTINIETQKTWRKNLTWNYREIYHINCTIHNNIADIITDNIEKILYITRRDWILSKTIIQPTIYI